MKKIIIVLFSLLFTQSLEVDGGLTVTEGVTASSFTGNGSGLTNLPSLGDMKPERIYSHELDSDESILLTVPDGKYWYISASAVSIVRIFKNSNEVCYLSYYSNNSHFSEPRIIFWGEEFELRAQTFDALINIYEYPISGSGTSQGMDYIEP